ncbi:MAG: c-type cytochrome [Persicimonas sp.]
MSASLLKRLFISILCLAFIAGLGVACDKSGEASAGDGEAKAAADDGPATDIDNGGITEVPSDPELVSEGKELFAAKTCTACHQMDKKMVGPPLRGVTERREAAWLAQMIMHPDEMLEEDPEAKKLLEEYGSPMTDVGVTAEEAKALIAYLGSET